MPTQKQLLTLLLLLTALPLTNLAQAEAPKPTRNDIHISGVYPHLTTYGIYSQNGAHRKGGHNECGIGAIVPWADKLWIVNYAPHMPRGSEHKLFSITSDLKTMTVHPESVGGTPAGRMIHRESKQLLIAHYLIDANGKVRAISPTDMPIRVTAITRHLTDPGNMVYYVDMEGSIWEANVHTLAVKRLFKKPVPGWHSKGGYTGQGRLVISNNGEHAAGNYNDLLVGGAAKDKEEAGILAEWDGTTWNIIERRQYTDITGPAGIAGGGDNDAPIWAIGWDRRSLRLKLLENGKWHTYLLPKAAFCNDARHGWYTEWPRIREITEGRWLMDMHGMFFDFPKTFSSSNSAGIQPIGSHLRYVPDFCDWNDQLVLATDETSIQGNKLAGQPQSNLWFGSYEDLKTWGPASGFGGPWIQDQVKAHVPSDPFLVAGFGRRILHLATNNKTPFSSNKALRASDQQEITSMPAKLASLSRVTVNRGTWHEAAPGFSFKTNHAATIYLAVDQRGKPTLDESWRRTNLTLSWGRDNHDIIYQRDFQAGTIDIPANNTEHTKGAFGMPHTAFVSCPSDNFKISPLGKATLSHAAQPKSQPVTESKSVVFTLQVDIKGNGQWTDYSKVAVPANGYVSHSLPNDFQATWLRLKTNVDCVATAYLHQTADHFHSGNAPSNTKLFDGLADVNEKAIAATLYAAKRNRDLRIITSDDRNIDFTKASFGFIAQDADSNLASLLTVKPEFSVDDASVILHHGGKTLRLPKGNKAFDKPFASGWPRDNREVESERHLANIHGTFYEIPLLTNGRPPIYRRMRPVASHNKQITDYCSWNGLLVLAGVRTDAKRGDHIFTDPKQNVALWFGGVDDLWKLGKPVGHGGPWKQTPISAGQPSDPYLMTGYDSKTLILAADVDTSVKLEIDFDHQSDWHLYKTIAVKAGKPITFEFPTAFSAHWIRFTADHDCKATAQLSYE